MTLALVASQTIPHLNVAKAKFEKVQRRLARIVRKEGVPKKIKNRKLKRSIIEAY